MFQLGDTLYVNGRLARIESGSFGYYAEFSDSHWIHCIELKYKVTGRTCGSFDSYLKRHGFDLNTIKTDCYFPEFKSIYALNRFIALLNNKIIEKNFIDLSFLRR